MAARLCLQRALSSLRPSHMLKKNLACVHTGSFESFSKAYTARIVNDTEEDAHVLVRNFIGAALYDPMVGYFSNKFEVVGALREPLQFNVFEGRKAYMKYLDNLYRQNDISWFTPVEVFQPWYAYAIGEYILRCHDSKLPLMIYEIGGGTGTCARNILDYIKATAPAIYQTLKYTSVEISAALANKQNNFVHKVKSHQARYHAECHSAQDKVAWGPSNAKPCFVIMLEVLDNLPHDLVYRGNTTTPWMETWISQSNGAAANTASSPSKYVADNFRLQQSARCEDTRRKSTFSC
ncbi:hypothetical protein O6H91_03G021100 [Diphasiastrum complanatum]|uniref:Uncharacterized protein n=1 Tax=Diphasiastrum complanatum TaxID=34168 RepID=A0ACC2E414_DIPCM|nr:hypothetical protein O6H91_03G021100 [Diphasiastrum complanatum]